MKVAIIEPHLVDYTGHYYSFVSELKRGFEELGDEVEVFLQKNSKVSIFGQKILPPLKKSNNKGGLKYLGIFFEILIYSWLLKTVQKKFDILIFTSASDPLILTRTSLLGAKTPIVIYFHSPDNLFTPKRKSLKLFTILCRFIKKRIVFLTPAYWKKDFTKEISLRNIKFYDGVPYPLSKTKNFKKSFKPNGFFISYLGDARKEKNFELFARIIERAPKEMGFIVQCNPPGDGFYEPGIEETIEKIKSLNRKNVFIFKEPLSNREYEEKVNNSSVLWCLYDPIKYVNRISAILLEAFQFGKPVITTAGTWMGKQVEKYGGGISLNTFEVPEVLGAIRKIKENYQRFAHEAISAGKFLAEKNNGLALALFIKQAIKQ